MTGKFLERLQRGPLLCDGAMGTQLYAKGAPHDHAYEALNLNNPALVAEIHREYIEAGADIIETNTFAANRLKLAERGLGDRVAEVNTAAVELARRVVQASFKDVLLAGSIGPLGGYLAPLGRLQPGEARAAFVEQISALAGAGVDLLILETFSDLHELELAIAAARQVDAELPLLAQVTFTNDGLTPMGDAPALVAQTLRRLQVDVIGANCSVGPSRVLRSLRNLAAHLPPGTPLAAQPNAGWPERSGGRLMYPASPDYFADYAAAFIEVGAAVIGGCCGTTPTHIARMRRVLDAPPVQKSSQAYSLVSAAEDGPGQTDLLEPTGLARKLANREFIYSVEIQPPRGASVGRVLAAARLLKNAGANILNVAAYPVARLRMSPWAVCHRIQSDIGLETILNFPTRGQNILRIQGDLLAAHALNIRNLFVVMGDPTSIGDYPEAFNHHDVVSTGLLQLVKHGFNTGVDYAGKAISEPTNFLAGAALGLNPPDLGKEVRLLKKKIDSGADFVMTQPIYDDQLLDRFIRAYEAEFGELTIPIILSVQPLYNSRNAEFLHNEVPGVTVPQKIRDHLRQVGDDDAPAEGVRLAREQVLALKERVQGVYVMPPFQRYYLAAELIESLRAVMSVRAD